MVAMVVKSSIATVNVLTVRVNSGVSMMNSVALGCGTTFPW